MGFATPKDVVLRVGSNLRERALYLGYVLTRQWISPSWTSIGVAGVILLLVLGVSTSLSRDDSRLAALYFIAYESIYLLWPWSFETPRFMLPALPLACLYLAEGVLALQRGARQYPRRFGALFLPVTIVLAFFAARHVWRFDTDHGFQDKTSAIFWIIAATLCIQLVWKGELPFAQIRSRVHHVLDKRYRAGEFSFSCGQLLMVLALTCAVVAGVAAEIPMGRENLSSGAAKFKNIEEIRAARWITAHTDPDAVIMSRETALIHHYSGRKVVWFPPISNPDLLMHGIRKHGVKYVVVVDRPFNYYFPPDPVCFDLLYRVYPSAFRLVQIEGQMKIYEVI